jgi:hypothetical protein
MSDTKIKGTYIKTELGWDVRFKIETEDGEDIEQVMLHPNGNINAKEGQEAWFTIKDCPNLHNGGEWEPMAIVVQSDKLEEAAEKLKGQQFFKKLNDHAMSVLSESNSIPEPEPKSDVISAFNRWQEEDIKQLKKLNMKNNKPFWNWSKIVDVALILGIVFLAALGKDGWGWLVFILLIKNL